MGYPKGLLSEGEQVIAHKHPHFKMLIFPLLIGAIVVAAAIWLGLLASDAAAPWDMVALVAIVAVAAVLLIWLVLTPFVRWRTTHFIVTTDRVIAREGVIRRTGIDIPMGRIHSVRFEHDLVDRIFGCGTLIIESASEEPLEFSDIPQVEKVHTWIYRQLNDNPYDDYDAEHPEQGQQGTQRLPRRGR
ncbi:MULTISPECIES: PH domain-containing protein [Thermocrispum]|uniref:PH domain-containing protein n=2 Tax=Thermocrispum agreste TaxID=37925 RepID=A0ABD6FK41_9PSEU|nr:MULTISPECIES: PH domain-containing protein [Thermocrispum]